MVKLFCIEYEVVVDSRTHLEPSVPSQVHLLSLDGTFPVLPPVGLDGELLEVAVPVSRAPGRSSHTIGVKTGVLG